LRILRSISLCCALLLCLAGLSTAQSTANSTDTVIVIPFENASGVPGLQWISEAFPEILSQRLSSPSIFPLTRDDRFRAYDRAGIPAQVQPARATIYRVVEPMDVDYVVLGRYSFDGRSLTASAQILDMQNRKLLPESQESGPLVELVNVKTALAWDLLHALRPDFKVDKQAFTTTAPSVRLDAFENYIRGILDSTDADRIHHFREAVGLSPTYNEAWLRLGRSYFDTHQYDQAITALGQVATTAPEAREANFFLGLAAYSVNDFSRAESAFNFVAVRLPLTEIFNNLGVTTFRLGDQKQAASYFRKAVESDASDPDYHFNLALLLLETGNHQEAAQQLKECLNLRPGDAEARSLLDRLADLSRTTSAIPVATARLKSNYDEDWYRQLFVGIQAAAEERLAKADPLTHAQFHVSRGQELLGQGFTAEAQREFREAATLDPTNPEAHAGLARTLEADNDISGARTEAEAALRLKIFVDPLLLLARLDLRDNKADAAAQSVDRALKLDPANPSALNLKRAVAAKLAQKAPPLPN
jgi:tetratricopeptide (TPR) repeat protein/TolB-like protein